MGPIRNPRWEQKRTEGYVIVSNHVGPNTVCVYQKKKKQTLVMGGAYPYMDLNAKYGKVLL
jgi:hypothetical protein